MNTATFIKNLTDMRGDARLYRMDPPYQNNEYVVVSAVNTYSGPETFMFASNENGHIEDYLELPASIVGELNHTRVLTNAGYTIA